MKDSIILAVNSLTSCNPFAPCCDHQPTHTRDKETKWVTITCPNCRMLLHLHPQTYDDLITSMEIDEIEKEIDRQK
jgi:hypothetical protein